MGFIDAIYAGFGNYFNFRDRAVRSEFWYWVLFTFVAGIVLNIFDTIIFGVDMNKMVQTTPLSWAFQLATLIPSISVSARRLHDIGKSGWWQLIGLTIIGIPLLIYWYCREGEEPTNEYGTNILFKKEGLA